ncbi:MAG: polysaccharide deacetylase [Eubacteriales bacterium]|nr:polysaccharide deacetylase [Eubacteriales bacterium]
MERIKNRRRKRKRKRIAAGVLTVAAAAVILTAVFYGGKIKQGLSAGTPVQGTNDKTAVVSGAGTADGGKDDPGAGSGGGENQGEAGGKDKGKALQTDGAMSDKDREEHSAIIADARFHAAQYDYDKAIELLKSDPAYSKSKDMKQAVKEFEEAKASCVSWPLEEITHVFYHSMIVDTGKAFDGDYKEGDYNQVMTTIDEFNKITQIMYDKGYVMVSLYDMAKANEDGTLTPGEIMLPPGKIPFVLSQDDVSYYHYMDGDGYPTKLVVDESGKVRNEYVEDDGSISVGDYDMVPLIDRFVEEHPDFSYRGAKGIIALTGYNGILGYRTDISYETRPDDLDANKVAWLDAHPDFSLEEEREGARKVAQAMKEQGWLFASHTWGHQNIADISLERLQGDTQRFKDNVDPIIGGTDIIIFAFGTDMAGQEDYSGDKYEFLKGQGYNYFCNVDSRKYSVQLRDRYLRQGRRNLDGYRMYYNPELLEDLFDVKEVFDPARPVPVPPMG